MNAINRIQKNGAAKAARKQVKSLAPAGVEQAESTVTMVLFKPDCRFECDDDVIDAQFEIAQSLVNQLRAAAGRAGESIEQFITQACRKSLAGGAA